MSNKLDDFDKAIEVMQEERIDEVGSMIIIDKEYKELSTKSIKLFKEIKKLLSEENSNLLFEYDNIIGLQLAITESIMYKQGLKDGARLITVLSE